MFQLIEPEEFTLYKERLAPLLTAIIDYPHLYDCFEDGEHTFFLLTQEEYKKIPGGVLLTRQTVEKVHPRLQDFLSIIYSPEDEVWTGTFLFQIHEKLATPKFQKFYEVFYLALLAELFAFGVKAHTPGLCLTLTPVEYLSVKRQELWSFDLEVQPKDSHDGLFHGFWTLNGMEERLLTPNKTPERTSLTRVGDDENGPLRNK